MSATAEPSNSSERLASFGQILFELRARAGLSLGELGRRSQISKGRLSQLENSRVRPPRTEVIHRLLDGLRADPPAGKRLLEAAKTELETARITFGRDDHPRLVELAVRLRAIAAQMTDEDIRRLMATLREVRPSRP